MLHFTQDTELVFVIVCSFSFPFLFFFFFFGSGVSWCKSGWHQTRDLPSRPCGLVLPVSSPAQHHTEFSVKSFPMSSMLSDFLVESSRHLKKIIPVLHKFLELRKQPHSLMSCVRPELSQEQNQGRSLQDHYGRERSMLMSLMKMYAVETKVYQLILTLYRGKVIGCGQGLHP